MFPVIMVSINVLFFLLCVPLYFFAKKLRACARPVGLHPPPPGTLSSLGLAIKANLEAKAAKAQEERLKREGERRAEKEALEEERRRQRDWAERLQREEERQERLYQQRKEMEREAKEFYALLEAEKARRSGRGVARYVTHPDYNPTPEYNEHVRQCMARAEQLLRQQWVDRRTAAMQASFPPAFTHIPESHGFGYGAYPSYQHHQPTPAYFPVAQAAPPASLAGPTTIGTGVAPQATMSAGVPVAAQQSEPVSFAEASADESLANNPLFRRIQKSAVDERAASKKRERDNSGQPLKKAGPAFQRERY